MMYGLVCQERGGGIFGDGSEIGLSKMDYSRGTMNCVLGNVNIE